jgi:NAD(P)-dependent dehydrogenase (short-subunit alcohol dehydrogenase family)
MADYVGCDLLTGQRALITGGDSGIGRAVAIAFAKEGADIAIAYLIEHEDAERTAELVRAEGRHCVLLPGDLAEGAQCREVVAETMRRLGGLNILVNSVATQWPVDSPEELTEKQWMRTFDVNIHSYFRVTDAALEHLGDGDVIINTSACWNGSTPNCPKQTVRAGPPCTARWPWSPWSGTRTARTRSSRTHSRRSTTWGSPSRRRRGRTGTPRR